jgi:hypothetical protein
MFTHGLSMVVITLSEPQNGHVPLNLTPRIDSSMDVELDGSSFNMLSATKFDDAGKKGFG